MNLRSLSPTTLALAVCLLGQLEKSSAATLITTSGSAINENVSISLDVTFVVTAAGQANILMIGPIIGDANRDAVRFTGSQQLTIYLNSTVFTTPYMDWNDSSGSSGPGSPIPNPDERSWIYIEDGPWIQPGDIIRISGTATGGTFEFGNDAATFSVLPTGYYSSVGLYNAATSNQLAAVPEPSAVFSCALGAFGILLRRNRRN